MSRFSVTEPTDEQRQQAGIVETELCEVVNRLAREGFPAAILLAGIGSTAASLLVTQLGVEAVPRWFQGQADMLASVLTKGH